MDQWFRTRMALVSTKLMESLKDNSVIQHINSWEEERQVFIYTLIIVMWGTLLLGYEQYSAFMTIIITTIIYTHLI